MNLECCGHRNDQTYFPLYYRLIGSLELVVYSLSDYPQDASKLFDFAMQDLKRGDVYGAERMLSLSLQIEERPATFFERAKLKFQLLDYPQAHYDATRAIEMARELKLESIQSEPYLKLLAEIQPHLDAKIEMDRTLARLAMAGDLHGLFQVLDLLKFEDAMMKIARPSLRMILKKDPADKAASKIGGWPMLPDDVGWPTNAAGVPLAFLCQLDLSILVGTSFAEVSEKKTGILSFFYDAEKRLYGLNLDDGEGWKVLYTSSEIRLCYPEEPEDHSPDAIFDSYSFTLEEELTFPESDYAPHLGMSLEESSAFYSLCKEWYGRHCFETHRLFGYPQLAQGPLEMECQLASNGITLKEFASFEPELAKEHTDNSKNWIMLLQLDSIFDTNFWWGSGGKLYFCILKDDLAAGNFDKVWVISQSS